MSRSPASPAAPRRERSSLPLLPALRPVPKDAATCESGGDARLAALQVVLQCDRVKRTVLFLPGPLTFLVNVGWVFVSCPQTTSHSAWCPSRIPPGAGIPLPARLCLVTGVVTTMLSGSDQSMIR